MGILLGDQHHHRKYQRHFQLRHDIAADFRRKGYAAKRSAILKYYFEKLRYQKVTVNIHSDNLASIQLHAG
jgi:RimJ/RimL family protein N-acetyltransferase